MTPGAEVEDDRDIHDRKNRYAKTKKVFDEADILPENRELILNWINGKVEDHRLSILRQEKLLGVMGNIGRTVNKSFTKLTDKDIIQYWREIKNQPRHLYRKKKIRGKIIVKQYKTKDTLSPWTQHTYGIIYKGFFSWLVNEGKLPAEILKTLKNDIKLPEKSDLMKPPRREDIITWPEAVDLSLATKNPMYTALVQTLWDSGARIEEILTLDWEDIKSAYNNKGLYLCLQKSKTEEGKRDVMVIDSAPALLEWMEIHPTKKGPLFVTMTRQRLDYKCCRVALDKIARRHGFKKPCNPHNFRKSEASEDRDDLSDGESKKRHGWKQSSRMLDVYRNPDLKKAEKKMLKTRGLNTVDDGNGDTVPAKYRPRTCESCGHLNIAGRESCIKCKGQLHIDDRTKDLLELKKLDEDWDKFRKENKLEAENIIQTIAGLLKGIKTETHHPGPG